MKKSLQLICLIFVFLILLGSARMAGVLPVDTQPYVEKKYAGWNGVLQAWVCTNWNPGGSFIRWLNDCAADFEKANEGVYIEFTPVSLQTMREMQDSGLRLPELVFFSPGVMTDSSMLAYVSCPDELRADLHTCGGGRALPVAMGGYIWAYNTALCDFPPMNPDQLAQLTILPDDDGRSFSGAVAALLSSPFGEGDAEMELPDPGIDLGLPAMAQDGLIQSEDALDLFIDGELAYLPVTQKEIARLSQLRDNGRGPDWLLAATGDFACTDQLLMAGIVAQDGDGASERELLAGDFLTSLFDPDAQASLAGVGAFSVSGQMVHSDFSAYAPLDALLNSRRLHVPNVFSEHSTVSSAGIIRAFLEGNLSAAEASAQIGFEAR